MNNFKNLPSDVLNNIFEYYNPYKTAFTNNIIKKNVLHNAIKRRYIKRFNDECIKSLYDFIFDINLNVKYPYMDISKITYKNFKFYYKLYYNNKYYCTICIVNKNESYIKNKNFYFYNKSYNHYIIFMEMQYELLNDVPEDEPVIMIHFDDEEHNTHHDSGAIYEDIISGHVDARITKYINSGVINVDINGIVYMEYDSSDYFEHYDYIVDLCPGSFEENTLYNVRRFLQWTERYFNINKFTLSFN